MDMGMKDKLIARNALTHELSSAMLPRTSMHDNEAYNAAVAPFFEFIEACWRTFLITRNTIIASTASMMVVVKNKVIIRQFF